MKVFILIYNYMFKRVNPFTNIKVKNVDNIKNDSGFKSMRALNIGVGSNVFRADERGIWLGAEDFVDAPFSVDMQGNIIAATLELSAINGDLDDIADGTNYGKIALSSVSEGKIVLDSGAGVTGSLPVANTDAKCTDATADNTQSKLDAGASLDDAKANDYVLIDTNGYINADILTADNIKTGTLIVDSSNIGIQVKEGGSIDFYCTSDTSFSEIIFNKTGTADKGWKIFFIAATGGDYTAGDLQILPMSSNDSSMVKFGTSSVACGLKVYGDIYGDIVNVTSKIALSPVSTLPSGVAGDLAVKDGKLYIHDGTDWVVAGTQS